MRSILPITLANKRIGLAMISAKIRAKKAITTMPIVAIVNILVCNTLTAVSAPGWPPVPILLMPERSEIIWPMLVADTCIAKITTTSPCTETGAATNASGVVWLADKEVTSDI